MDNKFKEINLKNKIYKTEIKNVIIGFNCRLDTHEKKISKQQESLEETIQIKAEEVERMDNENITGDI